MKKISQLKKQINNLIKKGALHIFIGNFINKFVGLCGSIFIVRLLTKEEYGVLGYVENLYSYIYIFSGLGLSMALLRFNVLADNKEERHSNFSFVFRKEIAIDIILIIVLFFGAVIYADTQKYLNADILLMILAVALPFQDISNTCLSHERAMMGNIRYVRYSVFMSVLSVAFRVIGSFIGGVCGTILGRVIAESMAAITILYFTYNKYFKSVKRYPLPREKKQEISWYSFHNMVANGIWVLFMITDVFLIGRLCDNPEMLADYKVAYMFPSNMAIIASSIGVFVGPYFVKNESNSKWIRKYYIRVLIANVGLIGILAILLAVFAKPLIILIYGSEYINVITLMRWLLIAFFINSGIKTITASLLATMGQAKINMYISIIGFIVQVSMGLYVIPRYGTIGLAIGSTAVYLFMSLMLVITFIKKYNLLQKI